MSFGLLLYPGFEVLDMAGPIEMLNMLARQEDFENMRLSIISRSLEPVSPATTDPSPRGQNFLQKQLYIPSHTLETAPALDVLLVPGGMGSIDLTGGRMQDYVSFIKHRYEGSQGHPPLKHIISICNGAGLLAKSGILDGRKATTNKDFWKEVAVNGPKTHWIAKARWVQDGNVWTTSGVSAGADGVIAWMLSLLPQDFVIGLANTIEWIRATSPDNDPFAEIFKCEDIGPLKK